MGLTQLGLASVGLVLGLWLGLWFALGGNVHERHVPGRNVRHSPNYSKGKGESEHLQTSPPTIHPRCSKQTYHAKSATTYYPHSVGYNSFPASLWVGGRVGLKNTADRQLVRSRLPWTHVSNNPKTTQPWTWNSYHHNNSHTNYHPALPSNVQLS